MVKISSALLGLGALAVMVLAPMAPAWAGGPALSVNAGPAQAVCFPAVDLTLFGQASAGEGQPVAVQWSMAEGPAPVVFSAPWALTTTATFSQTGTYLLRLIARSGGAESASTVTVTVSPASSQKAFYVDPDFAEQGDGSESKPWTTLGLAADTPEWKAVNQALAQGPVNVYFSAREARADEPEETNQPINILRADKSTNRLTIDGMSRYNTDDVHPSWVDYAGPSRLRVRIIGKEWFAIGVTTRQLQYPTNDVTVRGFETTGNAARVVLGGNRSVAEHLYIHDIMMDGANLMFHGSVESDGTELFGRLSDITFRNNVIERGQGEGIYFAGNYRRKSDGGWPEYGNTHSNILIEGNVIRDPGYNRGQGDGIDLKTGLRNVTVRGNLIERCHAAGAAGITSDGVFGDVRGNYLIEGNRISGAANAIETGGQNGITIRNNVICDNTGSAISFSGDRAERVVNRDVEIYSNTIFGNSGAGISLGCCDGVIVKNNLVFGNNAEENAGPQTQLWDSAQVTSDYNLLSAPGSGWPEGPHSVLVTDPDCWLTDTGRLVVGLARRDFHLAPSSPAIDKGLDLSVTGLACDFDGVPRPQGPGWDIGAYEWKGPTR